MCSCRTSGCNCSWDVLISSPLTWDYQDSCYGHDMVTYTSDDEHMEHDTFKEYPMFYAGLKGKLKKKEDEEAKPHGKGVIETVKFMGTSHGIKKTREITETYEETTSRLDTTKKFTLHARMSVRPQEEWTGAIYTDSAHVTTKSTPTVEQRIHKLEVFKKCAIIQTEVFCERVRQVERKKTIVHWGKQ